MTKRRIIITVVVAIFSLTKGGLMLEASVSGAKFRFKPLEQAEEVKPPSPENPGDA